MATPVLKAEIREKGGRRHSTKLRNKGLIPAVIYGHGKETKSVKIKGIELQKVLARYGSNSTVNLDINGETIPTIIKDVQRHITKDNLLHIDFQQLSENEKIKIQVPITLEGREKVESSSTILQQQKLELAIHCLPKDIVQFVALDVSGLEVGQSLNVGDLEICKNEDIDVLDDVNEMIVSLTATGMYEEEEDEEEVSIYESDKSILDV